MVELNEESAMPQHSRIRLKISHLFYLMAFLAAGLASFGPYNIPFSLVVILVWYVWLIRRWFHPQIAFGISCLILYGLWLLVIPSVGAPYSYQQRMHCMNNMRQLILACHNYESAKKSLPPAVIEDNEGNPMHSWRVLILPYIDEQDLYDQYDFDEPWDGPNNSELATKIPAIYQCKLAKLGPTETTYKFVSDPDAIFDGTREPMFGDIPDGSSNTIAIVEDGSKPINWMKPEDVSIDEAITALTKVNKAHGHAIDGMFETTYFGATVALADGSGMFIRHGVNREELRKALMANDGQIPDLDGSGPASTESKPGAYISTALYLILLGLPFWFLRKTFK